MKNCPLRLDYVVYDVEAYSQTTATVQSVNVIRIQVCIQQARALGNLKQQVQVSQNLGSGPSNPDMIIDINWIRYRTLQQSSIRFASFPKSINW